MQASLIQSRPYLDIFRPGDIETIRSIAHFAFDPHGKVEYTDLMVDRADPKLSRVVRDCNGIAGFYLLDERCVLDIISEEKYRITLLEDLSAYASRRGVEGVLLWLDPALRGRGLGNVMKELPRKYGFDYVWGSQTHSLDNIQHWLKRRRMVMKAPPWGNGGEWYVTVEDLINPLVGQNCPDDRTGQNQND